VTAKQHASAAEVHWPQAEVDRHAASEDYSWEIAGVTPMRPGVPLILRPAMRTGTAGVSSGRRYVTLVSRHGTDSMSSGGVGPGQTHGSTGSGPSLSIHRR